MPDPQLNPDNQEDLSKKSLWDLFTFRRPGGQWQGRVYLINNTDDHDTYIAYKFANRSDIDGKKLKLEEQRIRQAKTFGLTNSPELIEGVGPLREVIGAFPPELDPNYVLKFKTSKSSRQYMTWRYTDMHPVVRAHWVNDFALKGLSDLVTWFKNGYLHTSLSPLTHSNVFDETWFWNIDPIGEVQDLKASLRHTNLRRSGLEDYEHIKKIDADINLEFAVGQALVEWMITTAYSGFMNELKPSKVKEHDITVESILTNGYKFFLNSLSAYVDTENAINLIKSFTKEFEREWKTNKLQSPSDNNPETALLHLVKLTHIFLKDLEQSDYYNKMKISWLAGSSIYRTDDICSAGRGILIRKSWNDRTLKILDSGARELARITLNSAPMALTLNDNDILVIVDGCLLKFNMELKLIAELKGDFKPAIFKDKNRNVILIHRNGQIEILNQDLKPLAIVQIQQEKLEFCPLLAVTPAGRLIVADRTANLINIYNQTHQKIDWSFKPDVRPDVIAALGENRIVCGNDGKISIYNYQGTKLHESDIPEHVTGITIDSFGHILTADKFKNRFLIYDYELNLLSETVSYGNEHKVLIYSENMSLIGEIRGVQNPYRIIEDSHYRLEVIRRRKNMGIIKYIPGIQTESDCY